MKNVLLGVGRIVFGVSFLSVLVCLSLLEPFVKDDK
jgi:hypothetical protein